MKVLLATTVIFTTTALAQSTAVYYGGFALTSQTCPSSSGLEKCPNTNSCCPKGTYCTGVVNYYCCPDNTDCSQTVEDLKTCADPSWILWEGLFTYCCLPGQTGINNDNNCAAKGVPVASSLEAGTATNANPSATFNAASVTAGKTATATGATLSATETATSTGSGGGINLGGILSSAAAAVGGKKSDAAPRADGSGLVAGGVIAVAGILGALLV